MVATPPREASVSLAVVLGFPEVDPPRAPRPVSAPTSQQAVRIRRNFSYPWTTSPGYCQSLDPCTGSSHPSADSIPSCHTSRDNSLDDSPPEAVYLQAKLTSDCGIDDWKRLVPARPFTADAHTQRAAIRTSHSTSERKKRQGAVWTASLTQLPSSNTLGPEQRKKSGGLLTARPGGIPHSPSLPSGPSSSIASKSTKRHRLTRSVDLSHFSLFASSRSSRTPTNLGAIASNAPSEPSKTKFGVRGAPVLFSRSSRLSGPTSASASSSDTRVERFAKLSDHCMKISGEENKLATMSSSWSSRLSAISMSKTGSSVDGGDSICTGKSSKSRWRSKMHKVAGWFTVSEPSIQALKEQKTRTFQNAGVAFNDPQAKGKLHLPIGEIPTTAIKATGPGPSPEQVARTQAAMRRNTRPSCSSSGTQMSRSSAFSSGISELW